LALTFFKTNDHCSHKLINGMINDIDEDTGE